MTPTALPYPTPSTTRRALRLGCSAEFAEPGWRWVADQLGTPPVDWKFFSTHPRNSWEKLVRKPALSRYRACRELARGAAAGDFDLILTHLPLVTCWAELFCRHRRQCPHVAFAFNFTDLPTGPRLMLMRRAFQTLDRAIVFSSFERKLYCDYFRMPEARIDVIPWRIRDPRASARPVEAERDVICAVGSQGRDYATLLEAMRLLPQIPLVLVAGAQSILGLSLPTNVELRQNIPLAEAEGIIRQSRFVVVPLRDARTACGHVTIVYSLFEERPVVATDSAALAEYVIPGRNGILVPPRNAAALARAIEKLWNNPQEAQRLGTAGREHALANCLESQTVNYFNNLLDRLRSTGQM